MVSLRAFVIDEHLGDTHLMRMAARFSRLARGWAGSARVPIIYCKPGERKHLVAGQYLAEHHPRDRGVLILVAKAMAAVWKVKRSARGVITSLERRIELVSHYSFQHHRPRAGCGLAHPRSSGIACAHAR